MPDRVPKRRAHTKSRKGCIQCKQRHTKCNEVHPQCANCIRLEIQCSWPGRQNGPSPQVQSPHPESHVVMAQGSRDYTRVDLPSVNATPLCLDDMRLLHHWITKTAISIDRGEMTKIWQEDFIDIAFEHPFLLRGILAVAAVHKAIFSSRTDSRHLLLQADSLITDALHTYRQLLVSSSQDSCVPMFVMAALLAMYNLGTAHLEEPEDPISAIHHCFRLMKGAQVVIKPHWEYVRKNHYFRLMANKAMSSRDDEPDAEEAPEVMKLQELTNELEEQDRQACAQAIHELRKTYISTANNVETADVYSVLFVWPSVVEDRYLDLLATRSPVATIILSYFAILMAKGQQAWWFEGWGRRIIIAAKRTVDGHHELEKWMQQPMAALQAHD